VAAPVKAEEFRRLDVQDAHLKIDKNEEIPVNIGSRLFA
jgi:hypothetical protein